VSGSKKHFEIERKYRLSEEEYADLPTRLAKSSFKTGRKIVENDTFFPVAKKGDMMRIRDEEFEGSTTHILTQKTWIETGGSKERSEREEEISEFVRESIFEIAARMSSTPLKKLSKQRALFEKEQSAGAKVVVTLDYVRELGENSGPYMEIELIIENEADVQSARDKIQELASKLLNDSRDYVHMSYQDMVNEMSKQK
jgi:predicted adenylyl cyclase CyaB